MIKANISRENPQQEVTVAGSIPEILSDLALLIGSIYTQFKNASPATAEQLRMGIARLALDSNSPMWRVSGNQTGIIFRRPDKDGYGGED